MLRGFAKGLGAIAVFVVALALGFYVHLNVPAVQRAVVQRVNDALAPVFVGKLTIERVGALGLSRAAGVDARMEDADGTLVARVTGVEGRVATPVLVRALLRGAVDVRVFEASVKDAAIDLDAYPDGTLRMAHAFQPREAAQPNAPVKPVHLELQRVHVGHVAVRGRPPGAPPLDGDVDDADASLALDAEHLRVDLARAKWLARGIAGGTDARGDAEGQLTVPSASGRPFGLRIATTATAGAVAAKADATYDGGRVDGSVSVPAVAPEAVRALGVAWPFTAPVAVDGEAHGDLPKLGVRAHAGVEGATLDVDGDVTLGAGVEGTLHLDAKRVNAAVIAAGAPATDLSATGDAGFAVSPAGGVDAKFALQLAPGTIAKTASPSATITGEARRAAPSGPAEPELTVTAKARVHEPGAPTTLEVRVVPRKKGVRVEFQADSNDLVLERVRVVRGLAQGHAISHADGVVDLGAGTVDAHATVAADSLRAFGVAADRAQVDVRASGPLADPALDVHLEGQGVDVWRLQCSTLTATGRVRVARGLTLEGVELDAIASGQKVHGAAGDVHVEGSTVAVEDAEVRGFGAPVETTMRYAPGRLYLKAVSGDLDLTRVARVLRVDDVRKGHMSLDVDAEVQRGRAEGRVDFDVKGAAFGGFDDANARVRATLHGRQASGALTASIAEVGTLDVQSKSIQVGEQGPLSLSSWRRAWGAVDVKAHVDLPGLVARLPHGALPFAKVLGAVDLSARIERDSANDASPAVDLSVGTTGLVLAFAGPPPWRIEGVDPSFRLTVDGDTGATAAELEIHDANGPIARFDARSNKVPYERIASGEGLAEGLLSMPVDARLVLPQRELASLPPTLGLGDVRGTVEGNLEWHGSARQPAVHVTALLARGKDDPTLATLPVDLALTADYDGQHATLALDALSRDKPVAKSQADVSLRAQDVIAWLGGAWLPWTASARAHFDAMPLRTIPWFGDRQVRGRLHGDITLDGWHDDARASADLSVDGLTVGEVVSKAATLKAKLDGHSFDASAQVRQDDGHAEAEVHAGSHWGNALVPALDVSQTASGKLTAERLRAALLLPFFANVFAELDGRVDANAGFTADPATGVAHPQGTVQLSNGSFELISLGGEFTDASGKLVLTPDGLVRVEDFVAHGLTGRLEAAATARLEGLRFAGLRATLQIPKNDAIPAVFDGVQYGAIDGKVEIGLQPVQGGGLEVKVDAPQLHVELPTTGQHNVQSLGPLDKVVTGAYLAGQDFVEIPLDGTVSTAVTARAPITIRIHLGDDVQVVRGSELNVRLGGEPVIKIDEDVTVTGQIILVKGTIEVSGKQFTIEKGTITFDGQDPSNPLVVLTAEWTASDQTRIFADFNGPLKSDKSLKLRSDPALPEADILQLILTNQTQEQAAASNNPAQSPLASGAGIATMPINQALGGLNRAIDKLGGGTSISAKIDTSNTNPMPEVQLQIARDISIRVGYIIGTPTFGSSDTTLVTLSWAFARRWNLETTAGNSGTTVLDLIWQHRY